MQDESTRIDSLLREGTRTHRTLKSLEPGLGTQLNTPYRFGKDVTAYRKAAEAHEAARTLRIKTLSPEQGRLDAEGKALISKTKNVLKPELGPKWNERWTDAGFLDESIATPYALSARMTMLQRLGIFLKDHPEFEVEKMGVTAEKAEGLFAALTSVRATLEKQEITETNLSTALKSARTALQKRIRGLRNELAQLLADDDVRWHTFGYVSPADRRDARRLKAQAKAAAAKPAIRTALGRNSPAPVTSEDAVLSA